MLRRRHSSGLNKVKYCTHCFGSAQHAVIIPTSVVVIDVRGDREPIAAIYAIGCDDVPMPTLDDRFSETANEFVRKCLIK